MPSGVSVRRTRAHVSITGLLAGLTVSLLFVLLVLFALAASPAGAVVVKVASGPTIGLQPRDVEAPEFLKTVGSFESKEGHAVVHSPNTYVVYWDPVNGYFEAWQRLIDQFYQRVGDASGSLESVFAVDTEYGDKTNEPPPYQQTFRGAYTDTAKYPASGCTDTGELAAEKIIFECLTDAQIRTQLESFIAAQGLQKGMRSVFTVITPPGVTVCADAAATQCSDYEAPFTESWEKSFCSYHSAINPGGSPDGDANTILYDVLPWVANGFAAPSYDCQDGGYDPSTSPPEKAEEKPHVQEPNQPESNHEDFMVQGGLADLVINQGATELSNTLTNPLMDAWQDSAGNEVTDECRNFFDYTNKGFGGLGGGALSGSSGPNSLTGAGTLGNQVYEGGHYYLNNVYNRSAWLLHAPPCIASVALDPHFTSPNPVNAGEIIGFDGMESEQWLTATSVFSPTGVPSTTYNTFTWEFGDGSAPVSGYAPGAPACESPWLTPCAASVFHSYTYGGTYNVSLKVRDVGGHEADYTSQVTVVGPPPPGSGGGGGSGSGSGSGSGTGTGSTAGGSTTGGGGSGSGAGGSTGIPNPTASAAVISHSLRSVKKSGLLVAYSVNEEVAGHVEVLIGSTVAHRLGLSGPAASGLPAGSPPSVVLAKALVVTTKGGRSTVKVFLSKRNAARLARQRKVAFVLRMFVRNAAPKPATATVLATFSLSH
jgi:hypothetical protein